MTPLQHLYILIFTINVKAQVVSKENTRTGENNNDKIGISGARRFLEDASQWQVNHLKDVNGIKECEETLQDKINKYRKNFKHDAAKIEYVVAEPLAVDEHDLIMTNKCKNNATVYSELMSEFKKKPMIKNTGTGAVNGNLNAKGTPNPSIKVPSAINKTRRSEYQFGSAEYYDDGVDDEPPTCPDVVVVELEIDQLRTYDLECEAITQWMSLVDVL